MKVRKTWKQRMAMFLSLSLLFTSTQQVAWAVDAEENREYEIYLDGEQLLVEAEKAIRNDYYYDMQSWGFEKADVIRNDEGETEVVRVAAEEYETLFSTETGDVYFLENIPFDEEKGGYDQLPNDAGMMMFVKVEEDESTENSEIASDNNAEESEEIEWEKNADYELTGEEKIIILYLNESDNRMSFHLNISGQSFGTVYVESGSALAAELETKTETIMATGSNSNYETATDSNANEKNVTATDSDAKEEYTSGTNSKTETEEEGSVKESKDDEEEEKADSEDESDSGVEMEDEKDEGAEENDVLVEVEPDAEEASDSNAVSQAASVSKSGRVVNVVMVANDEETQDAVSEIETEVYQTVFLTQKTNPFIRLFTGENTDAGSASVQVFTTRTLMAASVTNPLSNLTVDVYDYQDVLTEYNKTDDDAGFNKQVLTEWNKDTTKNPFLLYVTGTKHTSDTSNSNFKTGGKVGITQGIAASSYRDTAEQGKFNSNIVIGSHTTMFPTTSEYKSTLAAGSTADAAFHDGIRWYDNVNFGFFTPTEITDAAGIGTGYYKYVFDADQTRIRRTGSSDSHLALNSSVRDSNKDPLEGFWLLNTEDKPTTDQTNYAFGMHMSIPFYLPENGCFDQDGAYPMQFNFVGDDDVWVYLKDVETGEAKLILDMGGFHSRASATVNFSTMKSTIASDYRNVIFTDANQTNNAGATKTDSFSDKITRGRYYTLEFFYMERCPNEANCKVEIAFPVEPSAKLYLNKDVTSDLGSTETPQSYTFEVQRKEEGAAAWSVTETVTVTENNPASFDVVGNTTNFRFREAVASDAYQPNQSWTWDGGGSVTSDSEGWQYVTVSPAESAPQYTITCENTYINRTLTLNKVLDDNNHGVSGTFNFDVVFSQSNGLALNKIKATGENGSVLTGTLSSDKKTLTYSGVGITGGSASGVEFTYIPGDVTYTITETGAMTLKKGTVDVTEKYDSELYEVTAENSTINGNVVTGTFDLAGTNTVRSVIFSNRLTRKMGELIIYKNIVQGPTKGTSSAAGEDLIFKYEIKDADGAVFYAYVQVEKGQPSGNSGVMTVPAGTYEIKEISALRYQVAEDDTNPKTGIIVKQKKDGVSPAECSFYNYKSSNSYFSDVSINGNKVGENGFTAVDNEGSN